MITLHECEKCPGKKTPILHLEKRLPDNSSGKTIDWHGIIMPTIGAKVGPEMNELVALVTESTKRFGPFLTNTLMAILLNGGAENKILFRDDELTVYGLVVPDEIIELVTPRRIKEKLFQLTRDSLTQLIDVRAEWKHQPHNTRGKIPVFPKHRQAIAEAMKAFYA